MPSTSLVAFRFMSSLLPLSLAVFASACGHDEEPSFRARPQPTEGRVRTESSEGATSSSFERTSRELATPTQGRPSAAAPEPTPEAPSLEERPTPPELLDPSRVSRRAPDEFTVVLDTTKGEVRMRVVRAWAPNGADRFYSLVRAGYYTNVAFFRVISGFMAQVGIHGDPAVNTVWRNATIPDDPVVEHNVRGMVSFATAGPNTRTTQFFINFGDNTRLDAMGFAPFARVDPESMAVVDRLYAGYGEGAPSGRGPMQSRIQSEGNRYLRADFPALDYIRSARIEGDGTSPRQGGRPARPRTQ